MWRQFCKAMRNVVSTIIEAARRVGLVPAHRRRKKWQLQQARIEKQVHAHRRKISRRRFLALKFH